MFGFFRSTYQLGLSLIYGAPFKDYKIVKSANYDAVSGLLDRYDNVDGAKILLSVGNLQAKGEVYAGRSILTYATSLVSNEVRDFLASKKPIDIETVDGSGHRVSEVIVTLLRIYDHCMKHCPETTHEIFQKKCHAMLEHKMLNEWGRQGPSVDSMESMIMAFVEGHSINESGTCTLKLASYHCDQVGDHYYLSLASEQHTTGSEISFSKDGNVTIVGEA